MTFLPIVERELIEASRRRSTYWVRLFAAASGLGLGWMVLFAMRGSSTAEFGVGLDRKSVV